MDLEEFLAVIGGISQFWLHMVKLPPNALNPHPRGQCLCQGRHDGDKMAGPVNGTRPYRRFDARGCLAGQWTPRVVASPVGHDTRLPMPVWQAAARAAWDGPP